MPDPAVPPCPPWCAPDFHAVYHDVVAHHSEPIHWNAPGDDAPSFEFNLVRIDENWAWPSGNSFQVGRTEVSFRVVPKPKDFDVDAIGWVGPAAALRLAGCLTQMACLAVEPAMQSVR